MQMQFTQEPAKDKAPLSILVIDDSKTIRHTARAILGNAGFHVVCAQNGFEALAAIVEHKPDLILLDVVMPRLDGCQTCAIIKNNSNYKDIPVVMLSSRNDLFDRARARMIGAADYVVKPFSENTLLEITQCYLPLPR